MAVLGQVRVGFLVRLYFSVSYGNNSIMFVTINNG